MPTTTIIAAYTMPIIALIYALVRKPAWWKQMQAPNWAVTNIISCVAGCAMGSVYLIEQFFDKSTDFSLFQQAFYAQAYSVLGYTLILGSFTDWLVTKVDRHIMRFLYTIELILGTAYCLSADRIGWVFALFNVGIVGLCLLAPYLAIPKKRKDASLTVLSNAKSRVSTIMLELNRLEKGSKAYFIKKTELEKAQTALKEATIANREYCKIVPIGASDARLLAVELAATFPIFTRFIAYPIVGFLIMGFILTVWFYAYSGSVVKTDKNGKVTVAQKQTFGAKRILSQKAKNLGAQRIPLAPAITLPFVVCSIAFFFI